MRFGSLVFRNIHRHRRSFAFSVVGIVIGVTSFLLFMALGEGLHQNVLERVYVVNQLEIVPRRYDVGAFQGEGTLFGGGTGLDEYTLEDLRALPGVVAVYPKMQLAFPSIAAGGEAIFGRRFWTELIADGIPAELVRAELPEPSDRNDAFRDWDGEPFTCDPAGAPGVGEAMSCPAGRTCNAEGECERLACTPSDEILAAPDESAAERVRDCLADRLRERRGLNLEVSTIPEPLRQPDERLPVRIRVASRYLDEARVVLGQVLPASPPAPEPEAEGTGAGTGEGTGRRAARRRRPCDDLPSLEAVRILRGDEHTCTDPPSYCVTDTRRCEMPIPVVASNFLFEIFDTNMQTVLSGSSRAMPRLTQNGLLGFTFDASFGRGVLGTALRLDEVGVTNRQLRLVGWSPRAMRLGVTMPLGYVQRLNAAYKGEQAEGEFHSILVLSNRSEDLAAIAQAVQELGLGIDDSYEQAKRGSLMIQLLTLGLLFISALIIFLASLNITHTFLMAIAERRREIGVLRSVGARRRDIKLLVLAEAGLIGLGGAAIALPLALGLARVADWLLVEKVPDFPFKPDSLFSFEPYIVGAGLAIAIFFALLGAYVPASRASRMDPAEALRAP